MSANIPILKKSSQKKSKLSSPLKKLDFFDKKGFFWYFINVKLYDGNIETKL